MQLIFILIVVFFALQLVYGSQPLVNPFTGEIDDPEETPKIIVVITGASSGIGCDTAIEFAKNPIFKVYATMRNPTSATFTESALSEEQKTANLDNIIVRKMDVTSDESVHSCISDILHETGDKIDIIINNAGYGIAGCLESVSIEDAQKVFNVNVWGVVRVLQSVLPSMRSRKNGHIINISSTSGVRGIPCMEYYSGSKFALEGIADSMRYSLAAYNISVTQVNPGPVRTKFTDTFGDISKGGRGTRHVEGEEQINHPNPLPHLSYLNSLTTMMIDSLNRRMASPEAQSSESVAHVIVHLAIIKLNSNRIEDVPFTMGTNSNSQAVIEQVKRNPTGWGGMYGKLLMSIPPIPKPPTLHKNQHNREEDEGKDEL